MAIALPGYVPDVHDTDTITADHDDAVRDRAAQIFTTVALRDAAIVTPQVGQFGILTAPAVPGQEGLYQYVGATDKWTKPWNLPWGPVAPVAQVTANQGSITTIVDATSLTITFTAVANRRYRVHINTALQSTVATDQGLVTLADAANTVLNSRSGQFAASANVALPFSFTHDTVTPAVAGSYTFKLRFTRTAGSGTLTMPASASMISQLTVEDIGPNGAPS